LASISLRNGDLPDGFAARDIRRKGWSGLTDNEQIKAGLESLADFDWIAPKTIDTLYAINPRALR